MKGFPLSGPRPKLAEFMKQLSVAYEILEVLYTLSREEQEELYMWLQKKRAEKLKRDDNDG